MSYELKPCCISYATSRSAGLAAVLVTVFTHTHDPLYNAVHYNRDFETLQFEDGSQNRIDNIENDHIWTFFNIIC